MRQPWKYAACWLVSSGVSTLSFAVVGCGPTYKLPATAGVHGSDEVVDGRESPADARFRPDLCADVDRTPDPGTLDERALVAFLTTRHIPVRSERARADLVYVEMQLNPEQDQWVRLRVAILGSPAEAGHELHEALDQQGKGAWGIHRANIAILGPTGRTDDILALLGKTKLACWGVPTLRDGSDAYVIPGGYREL